MKCFLIISALSATLIWWSAGALAEDISACKQRYESNIAQVVAAEGVATVSSILQLLFNELDLNRNHMVSSSEIVVKLETEDIIKQDQMANSLVQMQRWVEYGQTQDSVNELNLNEFLALVDKTIGRTKGQVPTSFVDAEYEMCAYFNQSIPSLIMAYKELSRCVTDLKQEQLNLLSSGSERSILNTWNAVFKTIDANSDGLVGVTDLKKTYSYYKYDAHLRFHWNAETPHNVSYYFETILTTGNLTKSQFFAVVHQLMFGISNNVWNGIDSPRHLHGYGVFCSVLLDTRKDILNWINKNENCSKKYKTELKKTLNKNAPVADGFIFAIADADKNGVVTSPELKEFIAESSPDISLGFLEEANVTPLTLANISYILPTSVVTVSENMQQPKYDLSKLKCQEQFVWNRFCCATIKALKSFPTSIRPSNHSQATSNNTNVLKRLYEKLENDSLAFDFSERSELLKLIDRIRKRLAQNFPTTTSAAADTAIRSTSVAVTSNPHQTTGYDHIQHVETSTTYVRNSPPDATSAIPNMLSASFPSTATPDANTSSEASKLTQVVSDIIKDLSRENSSGSNTEFVNDLNKLEKSQLGSKNKKDRTEFTKEERELLDLLTSYDKEIDETRNATALSTFGTPSQKMTSEEEQLQNLLERVAHGLS